MSAFVKAKKALIGVLALGIAFGGGITSAQAQDPSAPPTSTIGAARGAGDALSDARFVFEGTSLVGLTDQGKSDLTSSKVLKNLPTGVSVIGPEVFSGLELKEVELPDSVVEVGDRAFYNNQITTLKAPGLVKVGQGAFQANKLTGLPSEKIEQLGDGAFADNQLSEFKLTSDKLSVIPADAFRDNRLTKAELPASVTEVGTGAFANNQLESFNFHDGLVKIGDKAFAGNRFTKVDFPNSLAEFGAEVFADNGRWIEVGAHPAAVTNQAYEGGFGHVVDAVNIKVNFVDQYGKQIQSPQILSSEFTEPHGVYLKGVENVFDAPDLEGFEATNSPLKFTPDADGFEVTATYKRVDYSPRITGNLNKTIEFNGDGSTNALLEGVTATDYKGNPLTVTVSPEQVDTSVQEQLTEVFYTAVDSEGRSKTVKGRVLVGIDWPEMTICPGWQVKDFKYNGASIGGLSDSGKAKVRANGGRIECWPKLSDKGNPVSGITYYAFQNNQLTSLPDSWGNITSIVDGAFYSNQLTSLPEWGSVTSIGSYAFRSNQLTSLPDSWGNITSINDSAFCRNKIASLPDSWGSVTSIGGGAFQDNQLTSLPDSWGNITRIGGSAFYSNRLTSLPGSWGNITGIGGSAFSSNQLTSLPDSWGDITSINNGAFRNNQLTSLPVSWENITSIGAYAFQSNQLTSLPASWGNITSIGGVAFYRNQLTSLPDSWGNITSIGYNTFEYNQLTSLPDSWGNITSIGGYVFSNNQLASLPGSWGNITSIGGGTFKSNQLTSLPDSWGNITSISDSAFSYNKLTRLPDSWGSIASIGGYAFRNNQLTRLPDSWGSIASIGGYAFSYNKLTRLPDSWGNITHIGNAVFRNNQLTSLPDSWGNITSIDHYAFQSNQLTSLPDSWGNITSIGVEAFYYNGLTSLPDSWGNITSIDRDAFRSSEFKSDHYFTVPDEKLSLLNKVIGEALSYGSSTFDNKRIYLKPIGGTNPQNVRPAHRDITILVDTPIEIQYVANIDGVEQQVAPTRNLKIDSKDSNTYKIVAPPITGYRTPEDQTVNLDGIAKNVKLVYEKIDPETMAGFGRIKLLGVYTHSRIGDKLRTDLKFDSTKQLTDGSIRISYDPEHVEFVEAAKLEGIQGFSSPGPGVLDVKLNKIVPSGNSFTVPIHWKLKERITPSGAKYPLTATLMSGRDAGITSDPVDLSGWYRTPRLDKTIDGLSSRQYIADFDGDGTQVSAEGRNWVVYNFNTRYLERNVEGYTVTDTLPEYETGDGQTVRAQFVAEENPGWALDPVGESVTFTSPKAILDESAKLASLKLHFPNAKYRANIENTAQMALMPQNKSESEQEMADVDDESFSFFNFTPPPAVYGISKNAIGPHMRDYEAAIFDTNNDRNSSVEWSVGVASGPRKLDRVEIIDNDLDGRLKYSGVEVGDFFVGGQIELLNDQDKVLHTIPVAGPGLINLPDEVASKQNIKVRISSARPLAPGKTVSIKLVTPLRDPQAPLFDSADASRNIMFNTASIDGAKSTGRVKILPAGKTFTATKTSDFASRILTGKSGTYKVGSRIETDYGTPATNFELVDVLPAGIDIENVEMSGAFASLPGARYEVISNINGTGRVGIKFSADQVNSESDVYHVGNIGVFVSGAVPDGLMTNEVFVRADGDNISLNNPVNDPIAGAGMWSKADNSTQVSAATEMYVRKQIRTKGGFWTSHIATAPGADFDYRLQVVNSTDKPRTNLAIYDLLPTPGDATLYNGDRGSQFVNQVAGNPSLPAGWSVTYTCDTGLTQAGMEQANWSEDRCQNVTGLKFVGPGMDARSSTEIVVPMVAGPAGSNRLSTKHLGQQAVNHVTYRDDQTIGLIESNSVINVLEAPRVNIEFKKLGVTLIPLVGAKTAPLSGATFGLFDENGQQQASAISGKDGMVRFNAPARVGWVVRETSAPAGFNISSSAQVITKRQLAGGDTIGLPDVKNMASWTPVKPITGNVEFSKVNVDGKAISGVEFKLTPKPDSSGKTVNIDPLVVRSNSDGLVKFYDVPAGVYELSESAGVANLQPIAPIRVVIGRMGQTVKVNGGQIVNDKARVEVTKIGLRGIDRKGLGSWSKSDGVALAGASFELSDDTGAKTVLATSKDGVAVAEDLKLDHIYELRETVAPNGYDLNPNVYQFKVDKFGVLRDTQDNILDVQDGLFIPNEQAKQTSSLTITKTDPNSPDTPVAGAVFELAKKVDGDWVVQSSATSNASGQASFAGLSGGEYRVRESSAPLGYAPTSKTFEFMVDDYATREFTWQAINYSTRLLVDKFEPIATNVSSDVADKLVGQHPGAVKTAGGVAGLFDVRVPLADAVFDLFDDADQLVTQITTDGSGQGFTQVKLDATRTYKLVETSAPKGYIKKSNPLFVRIGDHALRSGFNGTVLIDVPNTPRKGKVTISKMAAGNGKPLGGAKFELSGPGGFKKSATTDKAGLASFDGLDFDTDYQLKEVSAPKGFKTDDSVRTIRVGEDNPISTQVIYNKADSQELVIHKVTDASKPLAGVEFTLEDEAGKQVRLPASDSQGVVRATLETGQVYRIKEVATVDGFALLPQDISVKFNESGTLQLVDGGVATAKVAGADGLVIVNYPQGKVPLSGRGGVLPLLILGALAAVASVPFIVGKRKKKGCLNNEQVN